MQLLDEELGLLAATCPDDGASEGMDFHHEGFCAWLGVSEDAFKDHGYVGLEVHGIIQHNDVPRHVFLCFGFLFFLDNGGWHREWGKYVVEGQCVEEKTVCYSPFLSSGEVGEEGEWHALTEKPARGMRDLGG